MATTIEKEYRDWAMDRQTLLANMSVELDEATETHLQMLINGGSKLQILIPSTYHSGISDSTEVFLVLAVGNVNSKVESSMMALNERLEQINIKPKALHKVLDLLLAALKNLHEHWGPKRNRHKFEYNESKVEKEATSDWEEEEDDYDDDDDDHNQTGSDDEGDVNASCYDIAEGEPSTSCTTEGDTRTRGYLHTLAEEARSLCDEVQRGTSPDMMNPLVWVRVTSMPMLLTIQLQFEVAGMIDERIAAGLDLTLDSPVALKLEFSKNAWSEPTLKWLKYECVSASQSAPIVGSNLFPQDGIDRFLEATSGHGDRHRSYGLEVLFPELTRKFFDEERNDQNPFIGLALFIAAHLRGLPGWCVVCWKKLPFSVTRMRTCDDDLCLYRFEELGLGVSVLDEVKHNPALVDVDISLAYSAAESPRDVFEPFPGFLLATQEIRGRSGWFSSDQKTMTSKANKQFQTLKHVLSAIPAIEDLKSCSNELALKRALTRAWYMRKYGEARTSPAIAEPVGPRLELWKKAAKMAYDVTRFILMTNRLSLSLLSAEDEVMGTQGECTHYQFVVLHDMPEKEAHFASQREEHGSFFAFHGSPAENWYSILRNGLRSMSNTGYMSTGASYGEGIYMATEFATTMRYARATSGSWRNGKLKDGFQCVAICEVINGSPRESPRASGIVVVPRENERNVSIRYLLVLKPEAVTVLWDVRIKGQTLVGSNSTIDLLEHYHHLQESQAAAQALQRHTRMSARSAIFLRPLAADENQPNLKQGKPVASSTGNSTSLGSRAVMQEFNNLVRAIKRSPPIASNIEKGEPAAVLSGTTVTIPDEDNKLSLWRISLHPYLFKESANLYDDFKELKRLRNAVDDVMVELEVKFPTSYPFEPPFVRVLSPRFKMHSGHVTVGGSICMELLTASGWSPACSFESLLVQVVMAFVEGKGRLDLEGNVHGKREYGESEAREAFQRAARAHGWKTT